MTDEQFDHLHKELLAFREAHRLLSEVGHGGQLGHALNVTERFFLWEQNRRIKEARGSK